MNPDELKQAWQSQASPRQLTINADVLLQQFRRNQRSFMASIFWGESLMVLGLGAVAACFTGFGISSLREGLPWAVAGAFFLLTLICLLVAGFKVFDRVRQLKWRPAVSDPVRACVEEDLHHVQQEIKRWGREALWWYLVPLNAGVMLLVTVVVSLVNGRWNALFSLLATGFALGALTWVEYGFLRWYVRKYLEPRRQELWALRESLNNSDHADQPAAAPATGASSKNTTGRDML